MEADEAISLISQLIDDKRQLADSVLSKRAFLFQPPTALRCRRT